MQTIPMTSAQRGIYYAQQIDPEVPMSVAAFAEFRDDVDADLMARAVEHTARETESGLLRLIDGVDEPQTYVDRDRVVPLGRQDFSGADDPRAAALAWIDEHRSRVVDLFADPLLETHLLTLGPRHVIWYCWGHHLAFDGFAAMWMMVRVGAHYTALCDDTDVPPAPAATMSEIAGLDRDYRSSPAFDEDRAYWTDRLLDEDGTAAEFSSLNPRTAPAAPTATIRSHPLDDDLVTRIRALAAEHAVRPASVITAAVALYLARLGDRDETMLSLPVAARDRGILRTSAGLTSNVLPIRARLQRAGTPVSVGALLGAVNDEIKNALRHQKFRHEDITGEVLGSPGGRRGFFGPMVNVMLFFEHIDFGPLRGELNVLSTGPVEDASINVYDGFTGGMRLDLEANPNVYSREEIDTHHERITAFLNRFAHADPGTSVADIPMMSDDESAAAHCAAHGDIVDLGENTLLDLLDDTVTRCGESVALIDDEQTLTHAQLRDRADAVAAALQDRGVGPDSVVAVALPRSIDQVIALHAVVRAGAAFLPVDPSEPAERLAHILDTAQPALTIAEDDTHGVTLATLATTRRRRHRRIARPHPDGLAYVLFTSGSTGKPKGVMISHRAIVNRLTWMQSRYALSDDDRVLQKTPATFDVSVWEFFWPFITGAALVIPTPDGHRDPWYLRAIIARHAVTTVHFVPSMLSVFAAAFDDAGAPLHDLASLRRIVTSGEALTPETVAAASRLTDAPVHNLYGPTEAAVDVTHHDDCRADTDTVPIGVPVWNTVTHVLDRRLNPQPAGAIGELYLGGVQLARGYRNRAGLSADRFVADPFGSGARLYRTGDLVRRRRDGTQEYLGRSDSQVKIRGQRVELGEIEAGLARLRGVRSAGVVLRDDVVADGPVVVGYVAGHENTADLESRDLRGELAARLPDHMVPTVVIVLADLPTTANGKLDRRALPAPQRPDTDEFVAPRTPAEQLVADTVSAVLGVESISMSNNFFAVGGNSLSATRVTARLSSATGRRVGLRVVFDSTDLSGIATALDTLGIDATDLSEPQPIPETERTGPVPLSPAQHRLWLAGRLDPDAAATYNMPILVRLLGALDVDALRAAVRDVVIRHEPLRTIVREVDGIACADVADPPAVVLDVPVLDARHQTVSSVREFASAPFDLTTDLPIRVRLVQTGEDDHNLALVLHHIAADGWSLAPLAADLAAAYRARRAGTEPDWAPLPTTYSRVSAARHAGLAGAESEDLEFWTTTLAGVSGETELPHDRPRPRIPDPTGATVHVGPSAQRHRRVRALADRHGVTPFMVIHAVVATLLRSLAQTPDIVLGTPVSGRGDADLDPLVGMFVNTTVLRTEIDKNACFGDVLADIRERDIAAFSHADLPFDRLVTELNPDRSANIHPFFQVSVALEDSSAISLDLAGLTATVSRIDTGHTKFDLQFTFSEQFDPDGEPAGLGVEIGYATALFDRATVTALSSRLLRLMDAVTADPTAVIGDIVLLDPNEQLDLVPAVGTGRRPVEHLTKIMMRAVEAEPDRIAVCDGVTGLTYRELDAHANRLARLLIAHGAGPEQHVAVALPRGVDWLVTMWAIARTGASWVPVDPGYPRERVEFMIADSGARLLVTDRTSDPNVDGPTTLELDGADIRAARRTESSAPIDPSELAGPLSVDHPAYLIYTSGTTGTPKGVVVSHRGLADFAAQQVVHFGLTPRSHTLHLASPSFDASVLEVLMALSAAATMHVVPPSVVGGPELADLIRANGITHAFLTPSLLTTMSPADVPDLEALVIGGEQPNPEVVRRWSDGRSLFNAYGPTETTVVATMSDDITPGYTTLTIGRPIRGVAAMVLDERLQPVAPGAVGELYIGGPHLARGYHGVRPLTSKHFVANPYGDPGDRMYRTGDLARWTNDRELEFRGRSDQQTKIRGHRIELGEIDAALAADDAVLAAVTTTVGTAEQARLVSYVTLESTVGQGDSSGSADLEAIRDRLARRLPRHMVPSVIVHLDEIPTTPIGKVDFKALPAPDQTGTADTDYVAPRTDGERAVAEIIAAQLGIDPDQVGRHHDFFGLGGNSLSATQIVAPLKQLAGRDIAVRDIFDHPTVAELAALVALDSDEATADAAPLAQLHHDPDAVSEPGPAQQQLWFLAQLHPERAADYNIAFALDLRGELDITALAGALRHVIERHEPLRTVFPEMDGRPVMDVRSADEACPQLSPISVESSEWATAATELARTGFDLTRQAPIRAALHRISDGDDPVHHKLSVVVHHIAADGWSMAPLARDLAGAYGDLRDGRSPSQAPLPVVYRDYLRWQGENLAGRHDELTGWWTRELDGLDPAPVLLPDLPAGSAEADAGVVDVTFDADLRAGLARIADGHSTDFMTMHAVLAAALHRLHAGGDDADVVIGTPVAGRTDPRLAGLVGMFVNSVVLRTPVDGSRGFDALLDDIRQRDLEALSASDLPFEHVVAALNPPRTGRHPLFGIALVFDTDAPGQTMGNAVSLPGLDVDVDEIPTGAGRFDLEVRLRQETARFTYAGDLFTRERIELVADSMVAIARQVIADPARPIDDLDLPQGTSSYTATSATPTHLADLLTASVAAYPARTAIVDGNDELTYAEVDRRAARWAGHLAGLGVGPEDVIAVALDRSATSVIATWAVTRTGAAVLPVDPRQPHERIDHMLGDASAVLGITRHEQIPELPHRIWWISPDDLDSGPADAPDSGGHRNPDTAAYVIYTSGSTGRPKGVTVTHRGLAAFALAQQTRHQVAAGDRTLHFASPAFDASFLEFLLAFTSGATMVIAPPTIYGGEELVEFLDAQRITHAFVTPAALAGTGSVDLPALRSLAVGGEASTPALVERWGTGRDYLNAYGPTETTIVTTMSGPLQAGDPITIGAPIEGTEALVLDRRLRPVPPMVPGELYLAGPGVARGYLRRPALTATRFVAGPDGSVMYRSGDIVHRTLAGDLVYHGRSDNQVKVRGFRIELDEVSAAVSVHPAVDFAVTVVRGEGAGAVLASYVTLHPGTEAGGDALRTAAAGRLPRHMVPATVTVLDAIPLTTNGKLDRAALPEPVRTATPTSRRPAGSTEQTLARLVGDVLGVDAETISADDDFFTLGGTSLQATTLTSRLNQLSTRAWRVRDVFDNPRIADLADLLGDDVLDITDAPVTEALPPAGPRPVRVPLAPMQRRLWSMAAADPESTDYLMPFSLRFHGQLDVDALHGALVDIVSRHAVLRTIYPRIDGTPVGVVLDDPSAVVGELTRTRGELLSPLDIRTNSPVRAGLTGDGGADHTLTLVLHHIAADGASLPVLVADLLDAYRERIAGRTHVWPAAATDYRDYALAARDSADPNDRRHWAELLTGAPAESTIDATRHGDGAPMPGATLGLSIDDELRGALTDFAQRNATTPFSVLHTALVVLLHRLGVGDDIVIGTPATDRVAYDRVVGMFVNTLALRTRLCPAMTAAQLLDDVRTADLDALDRRGVPFDDVVSDLHPTRAPGRHPLFQIALSVHDFGSDLGAFGTSLPVTDDLSMTADEIDSGSPKFDLQFTVTGMASESAPARIEVDYDTARYGKADAENLLTRLLRVVRALITDPQRAVGDVRITDPLEVAELSPARGPQGPAPVTFGTLLDDAVRRNPEGWAAVTDGDAITYSDLDARSNRLARVLLGRGVADRPETVVAMAIPRSVNALVAIWAIVKSGAAYVPVDPTYPADRIRHMLDDSGASIVVTTTTAAERICDDLPTVVLDDPATRTRLGHSSPVAIRDSERAAPICADQLAYVIYTSGSTGRPKGVLVPHRGLAAVHEELRTRMNPDTDSAVLHFASPSFDASVLEFLLAAAGGATLAIVPTDIYGGRALERFIDRHHVGHAFITPAAVASMDPAAVPGLTCMAIGGEAVSAELIRRWSAGRTLRNVYGPTETTIITTGSEVTDPSAPVTIGTPNNGVSALVLDRRLHPVPAGVIGELYLIGDQVTRGYHRRPELTATRFVPAPMVSGDEFAGRRMYRSGDLVRWTDDGRLDYVGRTDDQVQIRGFRVEPGEIDDALTAHPSVDFAVTVVDESGGAPTLRSYVTVYGTTGFDAQALRTHLAGRLPRHMVPSSITELDRVPLTPTGKLDRAALPAPASTSTSRAPRPGIEQQIAAVFADILEIDERGVGADDGFFDLGGNSLMATTVAARLGDLLGCEIPAQTLFAAPTPAELAALTGDSTVSGFAPVLPLRRGTPDTDGHEPAPLFVIHPAIGLSWSFASVLGHVEPERAVYGLQNPMLSGEPPLHTIGELAAYYLRRIRTIAPQGPYHLMGWSLGGMIAHEMATQLQASGDEVGALVLLDSFVLAERPGLAAAPSVAELLAEFGLPVASDGAEPTVGEAWQAVRAGGGALGGLAESDFTAVYDTFRHATPLAADWRPAPFPGDMVFVTATDDPPSGPPAIEDWRPAVLGELTELTVDSSHARMLLPENVSCYLPAVAEKIAAADHRSTTREES